MATIGFFLSPHVSTSVPAHGLSAPDPCNLALVGRLHGLLQFGLSLRGPGLAGSGFSCPRRLTVLLTLNKSPARSLDIVFSKSVELLELLGCRKAHLASKLFRKRRTSVYHNLRLDLCGFSLWSALDRFFFLICPALSKNSLSSRALPAGGGLYFSFASPNQFIGSLPSFYYNYADFYPLVRLYLANPGKPFGSLEARSLLPSRAYFRFSGGQTLVEDYVPVLD